MFAIERSVQQMPLQGEMLTDRPEAREEGLGAFRVAESAHAPLAFTGGLMAVLGPIVHAGGGLHEHMFDTRELWNLVLCGRVAAQLGGDDLARCQAGAQHPLEEALGLSFVAPLLQQDVQLGAMLVDGASQQPGLAAQTDNHLVEVPGAARLAARGLDPMGNAEFVAPAANRLVTHHHARLEQQFSDVT